jgi:hypothetical protein
MGSKCHQTPLNVLGALISGLLGALTLKHGILIPQKLLCEICCVFRHLSTSQASTQFLPGYLQCGDCMPAIKAVCISGASSLLKTFHGKRLSSHPSPRFAKRTATACPGLQARSNFSKRTGISARFCQAKRKSPFLSTPRRTPHPIFPNEPDPPPRNLRPKENLRNEPGTVRRQMTASSTRRTCNDKRTMTNALSLPCGFRN